MNIYVRQGKTIDDAFLDNLYADVTALYRLDQTGSAQGKVSFGPLPGEAMALLIALAAVWLLLGAYAAGNYLKKKNPKKN